MLLEAGIVDKVPRHWLKCMNTLTLAQNTSKLSLYINLSRCFNLECLLLESLYFRGTVIFTIQIPLLKVELGYVIGKIRYPISGSR